MYKIIIKKEKETCKNNIIRLIYDNLYYLIIYT